MSVNVKEAVQNARTYFLDLMDGKASGIVLEEVELSGDEKQWLVTLSAWAPDVNPHADAQKIDSTRDISTLEGLFRSDHRKIFKLFRIDADTGEVKSMKIRTV